MTNIEFSHPIKLEHIDRKGKSVTIQPSSEECIALSKRFDLESIDTMEAQISITASSLVYHVTGVVKATITQISVISNNPVQKTITQDIDAWFIDNSRVTSFEKAKKDRENSDEEDEYEIRDEKDDPEPITNDEIDIGEVAAQFLGLALDDYPRGEDETSGDYIEVEPENTKPNPFAVLKDLKTKS